MKDFLKMVLAVVIGFFILFIVGSFIMGAIITSLAGMADNKPTFPHSGVLTIDFSKTVITEQPQEANPIQVIQGNKQNSIGIWQAITAIKKASSDESVKYIFIKTDNPNASMANLEEIRTALSNFRKSGKAIVAYTENPTTISYYLASVADKIYMNANVGASPMITGVGGQLFFVKDLLDNLGVNVQLIRHGKYKSAGETFIKNAPSPENLEQNQVVISSLWGTLSSAICESRGISHEDLNNMINKLELVNAENMLNHKLVDKLVTIPQLQESLATLAEVENANDLKFINFNDYAKVNTTDKHKDNKIAIIFADGDIVPGDDTENIAGNRFAKIIAKVRADSSIKAVVLRVSSPGGAVLAADKIKTELDLLKKDKPLIASYGFAAASGGYWISNNADKIFSDATTITGSIGVFSIIPDFSKTAKNILKVNIVPIGSNEHSSMLSMLKPLSNSEVDYMQKSVNEIYDAFINSVSVGRNLTPTYVDSIAQGRVWTGADAIKLKLVDEIGTLEDAVNFAISSTGSPTINLDEWSIVNYPKPLSNVERILNSLGIEDPTESALAKTPFIGMYKTFKKWNVNTNQKVYARLPFDLVINN